MACTAPTAVPEGEKAHKLSLPSASKRSRPALGGTSDRPNMAADSPAPRPMLESDARRSTAASGNGPAARAAREAKATAPGSSVPAQPGRPAESRSTGQPPPGGNGLAAGASLESTRADQVANGAPIGATAVPRATQAPALG